MLDAKLKYKPRFFLGDGSKGLPNFAPFDRILVTAGAPAIPQPLIDQLKPGGILVIPSGNSAKQEMFKISKGMDSQIFEEKFGDFSFVPLKGSFGWS